MRQAVRPAVRQAVPACASPALRQAVLRLPDFAAAQLLLIVPACASPAVRQAVQRLPDFAAAQLLLANQCSAVRGPASCPGPWGGRDAAICRRFATGARSR